ncbi:MAG: protein kinase [Ignavibacteriales bacterium]|nr:protein kinase [Ignavibacteriales bacterium]
MNSRATTIRTIVLSIATAACLLNGCIGKDESAAVHVPSPNHSGGWFRQAVVDLGAHIQMLTPVSGFASSRGRGPEVPGRMYRFTNGKWDPILTYPYSDSPLISAADTTTVFLVHHLVHSGNCRPVLEEWRSGTVKEIPLPKVMWDQTDYVMFKSLSQLPNKRMWMVGQQGHILALDDDHWKKSPSPLIHDERTNAYEGDLNDVCMLSSLSGWAVGRDGVILQCVQGQWKRFNSPTQNDLFKISLPDERHGWIVGDKGTLLEFDGNAWHSVPLGTQQLLTSVRAVDSTHVWIVGPGSTLLVYNGKTWMTDESIKTYDDTFSDVDATYDSSGTFHVWVIGDRGIYTNSQSLEFSFTDITLQAALRRTGRSGIFFNRTGGNCPDLLILGDGGPSLLFRNNGQNVYSDATLESGFESVASEWQAMAIGDVNNDGSLDILELGSSLKYHLFLGTEGGRFRNSTDRTRVQIQENVSGSGSAVRLVDFDNDGNLDAYTSNEDGSDMLFRNDGTGKFVNVFLSSGITKLLKHRSFGATFGDFNNDGLVDIVIPYYVGEDGRFIDCFLNDGNFKFHASPNSTFVSKENPAPTVCIAADFNNDGNLDLLVHNQGSLPWLLLNDGHAHFRRLSSEVGFSAPIFQPDPTNGTIAAGDVNNDGWIDVFIASKLFLNQHCERFIEVSEQTGIQFTGHPSFADIDNDGDLDLFIGSSERSLGKGDRTALFRNNLNDNNFIKVHILGDRSNRAAIGAKVFVEDPLQPSIRQLRVVGIGSNPMVPQDVSEVHFGVQPGRRYTLRVIFPSGIEQTKEEVLAGSRLDFIESSIIPRVAILTSKSIGRTLKMIDLPVELVKFAAVIALVLLMVGGGIKVGAGKFTRRWYFPLAGLVAYFVLLHFTIIDGQFFSTAVSFGVLLIGGGVSVGAARVIIRRHEAQYVSHYKLLGLLGQGGMGRVFKAIDINTKQTVALKVLNPEIVKDTENKKRLLSEGQLLNSFSHPHIVHVLEVADTSTGGFIAMEFLAGGTLKQTLERLHPLPLAEIKRVLLQVCNGLSEVHRHGIVHRDLKTGNIMFDSSGIIRIMDFGLSKSPLVTTMTSLGTVLGTLGYVAPEQITNQSVDQRTDIFSLGVIISELLTNTLPFKGENEIALIHSIFNVVPPPPSTLRPDVTSAWDSIVARCLAKNPHERYGSAEEVRTAIEETVLT